jgi:hypothetical protein
MTCRELLSGNPVQIKVDLQRYRLLHHEGRRLISGWFNRAWRARDCQGGDCFEAFIFAWIAVNGWAACVTETDGDRKYLDALMLDQDIKNQFDRLLRDPNLRFSSIASEFAQLWPIFEVKDLRKKSMLWMQEPDRNKLIMSYLQGGAEKYQPQCWKRHVDSGQAIPLDWPHTLAAVYRVRCNLFHGEKAAHSEMDQLVVSRAFRVLIYFFRFSRYL